jgi:porin
MKCELRLILSVAVVNLCTVAAAFGQSTRPSHNEKAAAATPPPPNYSGDLLTRSTLTGDWAGVRNDLADKGITFDFSVTQIYQGVTGGGQQSGPLGLPRPGSNTRTWEYSGTGDFLFNLDTGAAGLWQGGYFTVEFEGGWNNDARVNRQTGGLIPVNMNEFYLTPVDNGVALSNVSYTQFLSPHLGLFFGKLATITQTSGDMNDFAHGKGDSQFLNLALNFNPVALLAPYSTLGAGVVILPGKTPDDAEITLTALDPNGVPNSAGFDTLGDDGTVFNGEARVKTHFFGRTGHQLVGGIYSDKLYTSLNQNLRLILDNRQLVQTSGSWSVYYNFDQYLYQTRSQAGKDQGWGVFGRFGAADNDTVPVQYFWSVGIGGKGMIDGRPNDGFGIGYYNSTASSASVPAFLGLRDEWGVEAFYNIALTPWCQLTPDIQYIDGGRSNSDPAWLMGVRLKLIF